MHTGVLVGALAAAGAVAARGDRTGLGAVLLTAAATWTALGGTSLARTGALMADLLEAGEVDAARALLPSLCGRDPASLDVDGLARAACESVAENTPDAQVAPLWWAAVAGVPGVVAYRGINTLDAMIGHRSPRYAEFGWAAARLDDLVNLIPARLSAALTVLCAPLVGGSPGGALRAWRRDAARHPSPNAGVVEATFAGALGVRLGGPTQYRHELEIRPDPRRRAGAGGGRPAPRGAVVARGAGGGTCGQRGVSRALSAPPAVAVGQFLLDGDRSAGASPDSHCVRRGAWFAAAVPPAGPDLGVDEVAQPDGGQDAERDPLDAVGQERSRIEVAEVAACSARPAGRPPVADRSRSTGFRWPPRLAGVDGVDLQIAVAGKGCLLSGGAVSESRSRAVMLTGPVGAAAMGGTRCLPADNIAAVDQHHRSAVDGESGQHLVGWSTRRSPAAEPAPATAGR